MAWLLCPNQKSSIEVKSVDATCDNKIFKATDGGHQLTKRTLRSRVNEDKEKCNAMKPPLPQLGNGEGLE